MKSYRLFAIALAVIGVFAITPVNAAQLGSVFCIELENHNWTQPAGEGTMTTSGANAGVTSGSGDAALFSNPAAPYLNSLINNKYNSTAQTFSIVPGTSPVITANSGITAGVSYASAYHNVLAAASGSPPSIHPSEPNYIWQEAGSNYSVLNDNDPYAASSPSAAAIKASNGGTTPQHLTGLLQAKGISWKSYQEDIDLTPSSGTVNQPGTNALSSTVAPSNQWTVPLKSFNGTSATYTNPYNGSHQYDFSPKHNGSLFFEDTNGSSGSANYSNSNPQVGHWLPLQRLQTDLAGNTVARYNMITPDQFNDMHSALSSAFTYNGVTWKAGSDGDRIAEGDSFLSQIIPMIEQSQAFQNNGAIVIWTDETEGTNADTFTHTLTSIVISPLAQGVNVAGGVYNSTLDYTHSSDLATMQEIFQVPAATPTLYLADAANLSPDGTRDFSTLFAPGTIPSSVPEPASMGVLILSGFGLLRRQRRIA